MKHKSHDVRDRQTAAGRWSLIALIGLILMSDSLVSHGAAGTAMGRAGVPEPTRAEVPYG